MLEPESPYLKLQPYDRCLVDQHMRSTHGHDRVQENFGGGTTTIPAIPEGSNAWIRLRDNYAGNAEIMKNLRESAAKQKADGVTTGLFGVCHADRSLPNGQLPFGQPLSIQRIKGWEI